MRVTVPVFALLSATACFTPVSGNEAIDADDDGTPAVSDCDDSDASSTTFATDADCDGVLTADDCNDDDPTSTVSVANDADCDGIPTADDCDDSDPASNGLADDADCDGTLAAKDCDDNNPGSTVLAEDADCDGTVTDQDCDDSDPGSTALADDADCDGTATEQDCDDNDAFSTTLANDADCDGIPTSEDCDDNDSANGSGSTSANDADCDGVSSEDDCDDSDASSTTVAEDADCDGTVTTEDCDDNNPASTTVATDGDCDGAVSTEDCNDFDPSSTVLAEDADCDTVLYADDCDDSDASLLAAAGDPDCDGAQSVGSVSVSDNAVDVDIDFTLTITFRDPVDASTLSGVRVGVAGVLDGVQQTQWVNAMPGTVKLRTNGKTVTWTPSRGRLQEFETKHWIEIAGVKNTNGQTMASERRTFETSVVDTDYVYRLQNGQFDASLANWDLGDGTVAASFGEPFADNWPSSRWVFAAGSGWYTMTNLWKGEGRLLEGHDGTGPAFMASEGEGIYTGREWILTPAIENDGASVGTSPHAYWLETVWQGPNRTLGYHSQASTGHSLAGMKDKGGAVYADHIWILHNIGHR